MLKQIALFKQQTPPKLFWAAIISAGVALVVLIIMLILSTGYPSTPEAVITDFKAAVESGNFKKAGGFVSEKSLNAFEKQTKSYFTYLVKNPHINAGEESKALKEKIEKALTLNGAEYFGALFDIFPENRRYLTEKVLGLSVIKTSMNEERAVAVIKNHSGEDSIPFILEQGRWKIQLEFSM